MELPESPADIEALDELLKKSILEVQALHGPDSIEELEIRSKRGAAWLRSSHQLALEAAESIFRELLEDADRILGVDHESTVAWRESYIEVAEAYGAVGDALVACELLVDHHSRAGHTELATEWIARALRLQVAATADEDPEWRAELDMWAGCERLAEQLLHSAEDPAGSPKMEDGRAMAQAKETLDILQRMVLCDNDRQSAAAIEVSVRRFISSLAP